MEQQYQAALVAYGMDMAATTARFGGNENLLLKYLRRFPTDPSYAQLSAAMQASDREKVKIACHTLKGVSGTLGLAPLYGAASEMMAALRESDETDVSAQFAAVEITYRDALALIQVIGAGV